MYKKLFILLTFLPPSLSFAFFCPGGNFNQINFGQTTEQVIQQCGKPDQQSTNTEQPEGPQQWSYYIPQTVTTTALKPMQGTLKTEITFDSKGKAVNISVNGIGVGASTVCGSQIQLGDTRDNIKKACGEPSFINKQNGNPTTLGAVPPPKKIVTFIYNTNPPLTLKFVDGLLESKQ